MLRNATLEDHSWRAGGGAALFGTAIPGLPTIDAGIDFWPDVNTQRTVVHCSDGTIRKDDGTGQNWVTLVSGLTVAGANPFFMIGGQEAVGQARKLFYCDGVNPVKVLSGDGALMNTIANPPADWAGANQPSWLVLHQGYLWGGGNPNNPHIAYRSLVTNHENFTGSPFTIPVVGGESQTLVGGLSYKGGLLLWKFPEMVYFIPTANPDTTTWVAARAGRAGAAGPWNFVAVEDDVLWVAPDGSWHLISATNVTGSVHATDLAYRKLGTFAQDQINLTRLNFAQATYYSQKKLIMLGCSGQGQTAKNRRIDLDLNRQQDLGERWVWWDRDRNECVFLRKVGNVLLPYMGDDAGQLWALDQLARTQNGSPYTFEFFMADSDFSSLSPVFSGRKKNLKYLQLEYDPRSTATLNIEVWVDGTKKQVVPFSLTGGGLVLPFPLPGTFGAQSLQASRRRRLFGRGTRIALRGVSNINNADISITRMILGVELGD